MHGITDIGAPWDSSRAQVATLVALEVVLLWPRDVGPLPATVEEAGLWPVFVLVVSEPPRDVAPSVAPMFELLERPQHDGEMAVVTGSCEWSVLDARNVLLRVAVRAHAPERFAVNILVPARPVLGVLDLVAAGATIGVTTTRRVGRLTGERVDIRQALHELLLVGCEPSAELGTMADLLNHESTAH